MRRLRGILIFLGAIALPSSVWAQAQAQATITEGWVSNVVAPGTYATPFVPQLVTPNISFSTYSANPVGATNATSGNVAGAANATAENGRGSTGSVMTVPVWHGPSAQGSPAASELSSTPSAASEESDRPFNFGGARYEFRTVAARATLAKGNLKKAVRTFNNEDVERQNQNNGAVKYRGKTENLG
jgi:hypothetical protein